MYVAVFLAHAVQRGSSVRATIPRIVQYIQRNQRHVGNLRKMVFPHILTNASQAELLKARTVGNRIRQHGSSLPPAPLSCFLAACNSPQESFCFYKQYLCSLYITRNGKVM